MVEYEFSFHPSTGPGQSWSLGRSATSTLSLEPNCGIASGEEEENSIW